MAVIIKIEKCEAKKNEAPGSTAEREEEALGSGYGWGNF